MPSNNSRRAFLAQVTGFAAALSVFKWPSPQSTLASPKSLPLRLGGPIFVKSDDPGELAQSHRKLGYRAAYCPEVKLEDSARIRAIRDEFAKQDVIIAEVGRWVNLLDADPEKRRANLKKVTDGLALAESIGARCCVDIAGSFSPTSWFGPHPDNLSQRFFDAAVENARKIIDAVKPRQAKFCYEMMGWSIPDSPESNLKLLRAIDREAYAIHLDPCNLVNCPSRFYDNRTLLNECFDKLGQWIISCHAKDLVWDVEMNVHFREVRPGLGSMDYRTYLGRLANLGRDVTLMLEHLPDEAEYTKARSYVLDLGKQVGITW